MLFNFTQCVSLENLSIFDLVLSGVKGLKSPEKQCDHSFERLLLNRPIRVVPLINTLCNFFDVSYCCCFVVQFFFRLTSALAENTQQPLKLNKLVSILYTHAFVQ